MHCYTTYYGELSETGNGVMQIIATPFFVNLCIFMMAKNNCFTKKV